MKLKRSPRPVMKLRRPRLPQLRTRVVAGVVAVTLVALASFDFAAITALRGYLIGQTNAQLGRVLHLYRPVTVTIGAGPLRRQVRQPVPAGVQWPSPAAVRQTVIDGPRLFLPGALGEYSVKWVPGHGRGGTFVRSPGLLAKLPSNLQAIAVHGRLQTLVGPDGQTQLAVLPVPQAGGILVASTSLDRVNTTVSQLALIVAIGSAVVGLLVALGVAWIMRRGLRPIETMAAQADRISAGDLTDRVSPPDARTEVGRLGAALNGMLARIEAAVYEREASQELTRRFFADASHELRTPLASLRANAELYLQGALPERPQVDEAMRRIALEAQRMGRLVDDMLRLARLDQFPRQQREQVDVTALVRGCAERAQFADPERTCQVRAGSGLAVTGDEELLRRAIDNLLANVHTHTPPGTVATITAGRQDGELVIEVSDDGPGVPAGQLPRIFDRFCRAGAPSQRRGSGLGLAIVTAVAAAHHGKAEAGLNQPHGLRVTLTLPAGGQPGPDRVALPAHSAAVP